LRRVIREAVPADYPAAFRVVSEVIPEFVQTEAGFRHRQEVLPPEARRHAWVAEEDGQIVGWGRAFVRYEESRGSGQVGISVLPSQRGRGIGAGLLARALEHLADTPRVFTVARADGRSFAEHRGFRLTHTGRISAVDPRGVDATELERATAELRTLAEIGPEQVFAVESVAALDVPADEPPDRMEFERWRQATWESPDLDLTASYAACVGGWPVAISYTAVDLPRARAANAFTGVLPEQRGRGLARLVKLAVIRHLAAEGVSLLVTENDETNAPMLAVNTRLGFRPHGAHYNYVREPVELSP
jgi:GNAT superfamily N-acetyltransferase